MDKTKSLKGGSSLILNTIGIATIHPHGAGRVIVTDFCSLPHYYFGYLSDHVSGTIEKEIADRAEPQPAEQPGFGLYSLKNPAAAAEAVSLFTSPSVVNTKLKSGSSSSPSAVVHAVLHQYQGDDSHATAPLLRQRRPFNVPGNFFVDHTCIDCDTCRWMAPGTFTRVDDEMSAVTKQPISEEEALKSLQALISCPTASIHTDKPDRAILQVQETFPIPIDSEHIPGVYHCGYHSDKSYGATSYLIVHPQGNILVDSPRYTENLARNIEALGGARYMFLTHKDDVADHDKWSNRFNSVRILHSLEIQTSTADVEMKLTGTGPWSLYHDVELIHAPGHSDGSVCLLYKSQQVLFTGDHLGMTESGLSIFEKYNHYSVDLQLESIRMLLDLEFLWILPGHGRRANFKDNQDKNSALESFLAASKEKRAVKN